MDDMVSTAALLNLETLSLGLGHLRQGQLQNTVLELGLGLAFIDVSG